MSTQIDFVGEGEPVEERRITDNQLDDSTAEYAGSKKAIEASSTYFTIYDILSGKLEVAVVNPRQTR